MKRVFFAVALALVLCSTAHAQPGILERLDALEKASAARDARLAVVEQKMDAVGSKIDKLIDMQPATATAFVPAPAKAVVCGPSGCTVTTASQCQAGCSGVPQVGAYQSGGVMFAQSNSGGRQGLLARLKARRAGGGGCGG